MTIVVAGYNFGENIWREFNNIEDPTGIQQEGLFVIADSIITSHSSNGHAPLLSGFKKLKRYQLSFGNLTLSVKVSTDINQYFFN